MPVCEICGLNKPEVVACRMCGVKFCDDPSCGNINKHLCFDCDTEESESMEDEVDETFEESVS